MQADVLELFSKATSELSEEDAMVLEEQWADEVRPPVFNTRHQNMTVGCFCSTLIPFPFLCFCSPLVSLPHLIPTLTPSPF